MKIVSVTTHDFFALAQKSILEEGFKSVDFIHFKTTEDALKFVLDSLDKGSEIDLFITDFQTKKLNGITLAKIIRLIQTEVNWNFPILIYSILDVPEQYYFDFNSENIKYLTTKHTIKELLEIVNNMRSIK